MSGLADTWSDAMWADFRAAEEAGFDMPDDEAEEPVVVELRIIGMKRDLQQLVLGLGGCDCPGCRWHRARRGGRR